jgi:hypothetical protein
MKSGTDFRFASRHPSAATTMPEASADPSRNVVLPRRIVESGIDVMKSESLHLVEGVRGLSTVPGDVARPGIDTRLEPRAGADTARSLVPSESTFPPCRRPKPTPLPSFPASSTTS